MRHLANFWLLAACAGGAAEAGAQPIRRDGPVSGRVVATKGGEQEQLVPTAQWRKVELGQDLKAGDVLRTNDAGTLALLFADRTQVRLGRNATMVVNAIARGAPSAVTLSAGKAWGRSPSGQTNLRVQTPSATAAIRGTEWAIDADADSTLLQVFDGHVDFGNEFGSVSVGAGEAARARRGQAPIKVAIANPDGREQMLYFVRVEDALALMDSPDARLGAARAAVYRGEWDKADALFAALQADADAGTRAIGDYGRYVAAAQLGRSGIPVPAGDDPHALLGRALIAAYAGDLREALAITETGLAAAPANRGLLRARIRIALLAGQSEIARQALAAGLAAHADDPDLLGLQAEFLAGYGGSPKAALVIARAATAARPDDADLQANEARIWLQIGGLTDARRATDRALAQRPQDGALLALKADILLAQNEVRGARRLLERALTLEPDLSIVRLGLADFYNRTGRRKRALDEALTASAENPSFGRGFVTLAELSYDDRRPKVALQQLDAADRLDPHGPAVPLARTAIALYRFDADGAIRGARDALARYQGRGGEYTNLSENQQSGSLVSQSFRFLNLEGWGRYYGDRAFDSFSPVSYPDQVLNRTPTPFLIRSDTGAFDAFSGDDADFISSYLQGAVLAPLSVVDATKTLLFSRRNFFEGSVGASRQGESQRDYYEGTATATGLVNGPVPFAFDIEATGYQLNDKLPQVDFDPFIDRHRNRDRYIQGLFGAEITPRDKIVSLIQYDKVSYQALYNNDLAQAPDRPGGRFPVFDVGNRSLYASLFYAHELGYRNMVTLGAAYSADRTATSFDLVGDGVFRATIGDETKHLLLSANYARSFGYNVDLRAGIEFSRYRTTGATRLQYDTIDDFITTADCGDNPDICAALGYDGQLFNLNSTDSSRYEDLRPYFDVRARIGAHLILQGQVSYLRHNSETVDTNEGDDPAPDRTTKNALDFQIGAAFEPRAGQWLRAGIVRRTATDQELTFAPIAAVGLRGTLAPLDQNARATSYLARWDAQWTAHLFTNVEFEHQALGALAYTVPSTNLDITGGAASLDRLGAEVDWWISGNIGLRVAYAHVTSRVNDGYQSAAPAVLNQEPTDFAPGSALPYVPGDTAQAAVTWAIRAPWRTRTRLALDYIGSQLSYSGVAQPGYALLSLRTEFEPLARWLRLEAGVTNLLDKRFVEGPNIDGPGRTYRVAGTLRF